MSGTSRYREKSGDSSEDFNKSIQVGAVFKGSLLHPVWFKWDGRKYEIKQVNYAWQSAKGEALVYHFSVSDGANSYEIAFNSKEMAWRLNKSSDE